MEHPDKPPRRLAWYRTYKRGYYISESSVYRVLMANYLITSPAHTVISARGKNPGVHRIRSATAAVGMTYPD